MWTGRLAVPWCTCGFVPASRQQAPGLVVQVVLLDVAIVIRNHVRALRGRNSGLLVARQVRLAWGVAEMRVLCWDTQMLVQDPASLQ